MKRKTTRNSPPPLHRRKASSSPPRLSLEIEAPKGVDELDWVLLTSEPLESAEDAMRVVNWYRSRYVIEEYHKALKTGCQAQERKIQKKKRMDVLLAILAPIALRFIQLREVARQDPEQLCTVFFSEVEWKCLWREENDSSKAKREQKRSGKQKRMPRKPPSLGWAVEVMARLAGWRDTKRNGKIGWIKLHEGWELLRTKVIGNKMQFKTGGYRSCV